MDNTPEGAPAGAPEHAREADDRHLRLPPLFRLWLACEFLLAVIAVFALWSQVGDQYHLDIMAWYWKLGLSVGLSYVTVRATAAAISHEKAWNANTWAWTAAAVALALLMGLVTYYYHVHEPPEDSDAGQLENTQRL